MVVDITTEPVSLDEVKRALNMQFDTSGAYEFNDDDTYLEELITRCRMYIENYTGLSLAPKTLKVPVRNELGGVEIPYGPITAITEITEGDGTLVTNYATSGNQFKKIECPFSCYLMVSYTAGYADGKIPADLKQAIIEEVVWRYTNRGDQQQEFANGPVSLCQSSINLATPHKRKSFLV